MSVLPLLAAFFAAWVGGHEVEPSPQILLRVLIWLWLIAKKATPTPTPTAPADAMTMPGTRERGFSGGSSGLVSGFCSSTAMGALDTFITTSIGLASFSSSVTFWRK